MHLMQYSLEVGIIETTRFLIHYGLHFIFPVVIAKALFKEKWKKVSLILIGTMLIDLDHLLASPLYDPNRCSIGFHPLHSYWAILVYLGLFTLPKTRIIGLGCLLHIATDYMDCLWLN